MQGFLLLLLLAASALAVPVRRMHHRVPLDTQGGSSASGASSIVAELGERVSQLLQRKDEPFSLPYHFRLRKGLYASDIKINFEGSPAMRDVRHGFGIPDNNVFTTLWVLQMLLEAQAIVGDAATVVAKDDVQLAGEMALTFQNRNLGNESSVFVFWPQAFNASSGLWDCSPTNIIELCTAEGTFASYVHAVLDDLGLQSLWNAIEGELTMPAMFLSAFRIPNDYDDTAAGVALGTTIIDMADRFPEAAAAWTRANGARASFAAAYKKYLYTATSTLLDNRAIDPRSYFLLDQYFASDAQAADRPLFTTWLMSIAENRVQFSGGVAMPFNVNNIDASVNANAVFGLAKAFLSDAGRGQPTDWFDADLQAAVVGACKYVAWILDDNQLAKRPDLVLTYYPPKYNLYWSIGRTLAALDGAPDGVGDANGTWATVRSTWQASMEQAGTTQLLASVTTCSATACMWDDFLGHADTPSPSYDDRLYSTAVAATSLLATWTDVSGPQQWAFRSDAPQTVVDAVAGAAAFLKAEILGERFRPDNAFFSGSVKDDTDQPFTYPQNYDEYLNGTSVAPTDPDAITDDLIMAMEGKVPHADYQQWLTKSWWGMGPAPTGPFQGYANSTMPYWSSPALTYATTLRFLAQVAATATL